MTLLADVAERVRTSVPALTDRVEFVADMAAWSPKARCRRRS
jgi:hypothetical protein